MFQSANRMFADCIRRRDLAKSLPVPENSMYTSSSRPSLSSMTSLPVLDTYRNFLAMPTIEGRLVLQAIRTVEFAA